MHPAISLPSGFSNCMSSQPIMRARLYDSVRDGWKRARVVMACCTVSSLANAAEPNWSLSADQELRYATWSGTRGFPASGSAAAGAGTQVYAPLTIQASGQPLENVKVDLLGRGGYVWSRQSTPGLTGSVTTTTDTVVSGTATYLGIPGIQPFVSMNVNLPTGTTALYGSAANARMDQDIVDLATFGEGLNIGPTVGVNLPIGEQLILTLSSGYTWRGAYRMEALLDPASTEPQATTLVGPGRVATQTASLGYQLASLTLLASASYAHETATHLDHISSYALGDRYTLSGTVGYAWTTSSSTTFTASWTNAEKNRVLDPELLKIIPESFRSNSAVYRYRLEQPVVSGNWTVAPMLNYMRRDQNSYNPVTQQFIPAKTRIGAGGSAQYSPREGLSLKTSVEHFWINENLTELTPNLRVRGWIAMLGGSMKF
ncbi:hypothetical protein [Bradyrhizobium liaoningense]|uniref:hypothetical protein n=1 Tax=Bradyrhizobium liaoningense TaxID=43992 RepID=UPI001BAADC3C|nr:hypothetical protein [Bradyrhizobium liaoningense]MBR0707563.1 hypothetical protein [Bradyrhizobium liaoningense]